MSAEPIGVGGETLMHRLLTSVACMAAATAAAAEPVRLSDDALRATFTGARVEMNTPAGTVIPVRFAENGLVSGQAGVLAPVLGAARDRGRWWTKDNQLCVKWFRWFEAKVRCVSIYQDGKHISWRGEGGRSGTGTITEPAAVVAAPAPAPQPAATKPEMEPADRAPTPEVVSPPETRTAEAADAPHAALPMRFSAAALGAIGLVPPLAREPSALLEGDADHSPVDAAPKSETTEGASSAASSAMQVAAPPPQQRTIASNDMRRQEARWKGATQASSTVVLASFRVAGVDDDDSLNVRSGPAIYFETIGELPPEGRGVKIVGPCRADWCPIQYRHTSGWVNRNFLAEDATASTATATAFSR